MRLTYGVQTFLAPVGTVISTCPCRDLVLNLGLDLITRDSESPISNQNENLNTPYTRKARNRMDFYVQELSIYIVQIVLNS